MNKLSKSIVSIALTSLVALSSVFTTGVMAQVSTKTLDTAITDTAKYIKNTVKVPQVGSIGGEWAVCGLARSGYKVPDKYYQNYYATVESYVKKNNGKLHDKKYTEYSRVIVALTAIGKDPTKVGGYDLTKPLGDYEKTIWQGLNGPIWALIALDSKNYKMPINKDAKVQATRDMYIKRIIDCQLNDGGFSLTGGTSSANKNSESDPDITGMALQALSKYQDREDVKKVTQEALLCMSKKQDSNGGFSSWGTANTESVVQMIVALTELNIPLTDKRFVKNGKTMLDNLMTFYVKGKGFLHTTKGSGSNQMASEQGFYGLVAAQRAEKGKATLYKMTDAIKVPEQDKDDKKTGEGLKGKNKYVKNVPIKTIGKTFSDIALAYKNSVAIESLASRGILVGDKNNKISPNQTVTRGEFVTILVKALGLPLKSTKDFSDVSSKAFYAPYVGTATKYGIISVNSKTFKPNSKITREDAAVMVANAAKLCGINTKLSKGETRDVLAQFTDYVKTSTSTRNQLTICYKEGILDKSDISIRPKENTLRCEMAQMIFNLLGVSNLL